jgi:hypothetical protein
MTEKQKEYYFSLWEKDFYDPFENSNLLRDCDFESIAVGFFIASGLQPQEAFSMYNYCITNEKY